MLTFSLIDFSFFLSFFLSSIIFFVSFFSQTYFYLWFVLLLLLLLLLLVWHFPFIQPTNQPSQPDPLPNSLSLNLYPKLKMPHPNRRDHTTYSKPSNISNNMQFFLTVYFFLRTRFGSTRNVYEACFQGHIGSNLAFVSGINGLYQMMNLFADSVTGRRLSVMVNGSFCPNTLEKGMNPPFPQSQANDYSLLLIHSSNLCWSSLCSRRTNEFWKGMNTSFPRGHIRDYSLLLLLSSKIG